MPKSLNTMIKKQIETYPTKLQLQVIEIWLAFITEEHYIPECLIFYQKSLVQCRQKLRQRQEKTKTTKWTNPARNWSRMMVCSMRVALATKPYTSFPSLWIWLLISGSTYSLHFIPTSKVLSKFCFSFQNLLLVQIPLLNQLERLGLGFSLAIVQRWRGREGKGNRHALFLWLRFSASERVIYINDPWIMLFASPHLVFQLISYKTPPHCSFLKL